MAICLLLFMLQWQQRVSYKIIADLNTEEHYLEAIEYLTYHNESPHSLETLYIHLYANAFKDDKTVYAQETEKMGDREFIKAKESERGYIAIRNIECGSDLLHFLVDGTILSIPLKEPLGSSDSITLKIDFYLKIPKQFSRLGYLEDHYEMVQWYPKICVYDNDGWHCDTYHVIGEFYGEYGSYDVELRLPGDYVVAATGERIEPADKEFLDSLIAKNTKPDMDERKTVRFYAENVHDFAWVCDPDFSVEKYEVDSINIYIFYLKHHEKKWKNAGNYTIDAVKRYNQWYGRYPYKNITVVDGYFRGGMEYPNLVIIGQGEDRITRMFEMIIAHEIGHQWFYGILGSDEISEAWLDEGFTVYTEIRYFEDKYGEKNSLIRLPFVPSLSNKYLHKLIYYITQTNYLERPVLTPSYEYIDVPIAYANSAYSKPALFLCYLEGILGKEKFDKILKRYVNEYKFKHPKTEDFIEICEEESGHDLKSLFHQFLNTTDYCDWRINRVENNKVEIENTGNMQMPVDVLLESDSEIRIERISGDLKLHTIRINNWEKIKRVTVDPYGYSLEPNYWNNYYPRKIVFKPILSLPSFDSYQILYLPYFWYGAYDGITVGLYLFGAEFADFDFVKGRHQWSAACIYGTKSNNFYPAFSYQTPLLFKKVLKTRFVMKGSNSNGEDKIRVGVNNSIGSPLSLGPQIECTSVLGYYELKSYFSVDSLDWEFGRNIIFDNHFRFKYRRWHIDLGAALAHKIIGSEWDYIKSTCEIKKEIEAFVPFSIRLFAGKIFGVAPTQEQLYLSGALRISLLADLLFSQKGNLAPQGHIHIPGEGNMRGYQTLHYRSDKMWTINLDFPNNSPIRIFADFGYYGDYAFDVGARLILGPISFNVPLYILSEEDWKIRWSVGF